jgi:hypothetical protein
MGATKSRSLDVVDVVVASCDSGGVVHEELTRHRAFTGLDGSEVLKQRPVPTEILTSRTATIADSTGGAPLDTELAGCVPALVASNRAEVLGVLDLVEMGAALPARHVRIERPRTPAPSPGRRTR